MLETTEFGESVYRPAIYGLGCPEIEITSMREMDISYEAGARRPIGRWLKIGDPGYEEMLYRQQELEAMWQSAREEMGDG